MNIIRGNLRTEIPFVQVHLAVPVLGEGRVDIVARDRVHVIIAVVVGVDVAENRTILKIVRVDLLHEIGVVQCVANVVGPHGVAGKIRCPIAINIVSGNLAADQLVGRDPRESFVQANHVVRPHMVAIEQLHATATSTTIATHVDRKVADTRVHQWRREPNLWTLRRAPVRHHQRRFDRNHRSVDCGHVVRFELIPLRRPASTTTVVAASYWASCVILSAANEQRPIIGRASRAGRG